MNTLLRNLSWAVTSVVLIATLFVSSCQRSETAAAPAVNAPNGVKMSLGQDDVYRILEQKHVHETLVLNVLVRHLDDAKDIAEVLILPHKQESLIRLFFYETGLADGIQNAPLLYEWTRSQGLVLKYDLRLPPPRESLDQSFPEYKVLSKKKSSDKRVCADILVPSLSDRMPAKEIERVCRIICYEEGMDDCAFFTTMDAYNASQSDATGQDGPATSRQGVLCSIQDGKFILSARP